MTTTEPPRAEDYLCFGCSPHNDRGLRLTTRPTADGVESDLLFDRTLESHPMTVHGGILMLVCDELMGSALHAVTGIGIVTTSMRTRFIAPVQVGMPYRCVASVQRSGPGSLFHTTAEILDASGDPVVMATATYHCLSRGDQKGSLR